MSSSSYTSSVVTSMDGIIPNQAIASALSLTGDAQYWEETISPSTIRQELSSADPSNPSSTAIILRGMKWLLANISKGRNVSDFYPHVVKLVGAVSLEVRKMVYMYLVQYANHNAETRELSLLSINAFQRGLADAEQWIRALALRVLTSIAIPDILQIQILAVQKCSQDPSPYVRKCAANALAKLYHHCSTTHLAGSSVPPSKQEQHHHNHNHNNNNTSHDPQQQQQQQQLEDDPNQQLLIQILNEFLLQDQATMVLTSALIAWQELCPHRLDMLHKCFRKFCHLLTDMDEWGQVVVLHVFARYIRTFFAEPPGWRDGSAERIDRERRVRRTIYGIENEIIVATTTTSPSTDYTLSPSSPSPPQQQQQQASKVDTLKLVQQQNIINESFYSDDEEDDEDQPPKQTNNNNLSVDLFQHTSSSSSAPTTQRNVLGHVPTESNVFIPRALLPGGPSSSSSSSSSHPTMETTTTTTPAVVAVDAEEAHLAKDHLLFLNAARHLLKSRNAGVVLAVCSLQYYCGVSSIQVRAAMGKALVRIHRDLREVQYVVLDSIRTLASECPSAFTPFLTEFFVKESLDPPFTRFIKLDILTCLALEPGAIDAVLKELRTYVRHGDTLFAQAAIRAVGRVVELARIVHDRHAHNKSGNHHKNKSAADERTKANNIALNALYGLLTLTQVQWQNNRAVVGEAVIVMRLILQLLQQDTIVPVHDTNHVQRRSVHRMLLLLLKTLTVRVADAQNVGDQDHDDDEDPGIKTLASAVTIDLPGEAAAAAIWVVGEHLANLSASSSSSSSSSSSLKPFEDSVSSKMRLELVRMMVKAFLQLSVAEKEQAIHLASKLIVSRLVAGDLGDQLPTTLPGEGPLCEQLLAMGRLDVNTDVRDRARFESSLLRSVSALEHDLDAMDDDFEKNKSGTLTLDQVKTILLSKKPASSSLPVENLSNTHALESDGFRFGTLSSLVGHRARSAYIPLPPWATEDSPDSLRAPPADKNKASAATALPSEPPNQQLHLHPTTAYSDTQPIKNAAGVFYAEASSSDDDDDDENSASSSSSSSDDNASSSNSSSDDDDSSSSNDSSKKPANSTTPAVTPTPRNSVAVAPSSLPKAFVKTVADSSDDDVSSDGDMAGGSLGNQAATRQSIPSSDSLIPIPKQNGPAPVSSMVDDLRGLVIAPIVTDEDSGNQVPNLDRDSSGWIQLVRPEHTGGLSVKIRFVGGPTRVREAQKLGLKAETQTLLLFQIWLESQETSSTVFRRIQWMPRTVSGSSIGPKKIYFPQEIESLKPGQRVDNICAVDFASVSDRDGAWIAKFDLKFGSGGIPVEIKPTLGYVLLPSKITETQFDNEMKLLQGFQRVESKLESLDDEKVEKVILKSAFFTRVGKKDTSGTLKLAGTLPASGVAVFCTITKTDSHSYKVIVCSDNTLAANSLMSVMKKKILASLG